MMLQRTLVVLALVLAAVSVRASIFTQIACSDAACSQNCGATEYEQGACYNTLQAGSSVQVYCQSENTVVNQVIYPSSTDCTGFNYDSPTPADSCGSGQYGYVEYICGSISAEKKSTHNVSLKMAPKADKPKGNKIILLPSPQSAVMLQTAEGRRKVVVRRHKSSIVVPLSMLPVGLDLARLESATILLKGNVSRNGRGETPVKSKVISAFELFEFHQRPGKDSTFSTVTFREENLMNVLPDVPNLLPREIQSAKGSNRMLQLALVGKKLGKDREDLVLLTLKIAV